MTLLTAHFTLEELGGEGAPAVVVQNLGDTARRMEEFRAIVGAPFIVTSGYRTRQHNLDVGGSETSDHPDGRALDGHFSGVSMWEVHRRLFESGLSLPAFDQIIFYPFTTGHIHFGFGSRFRRSVLVKLNETDYAPISAQLVSSFPGATVATVGGGVLVIAAVAFFFLRKKHG